MWFKYGLKAQKLLAQGIALGIMAISKAPCKGKSFIFCLVTFLLFLQAEMRNISRSTNEQLLSINLKLKAYEKIYFCIGSNVCFCNIG